jgi:ribosomal protein S18 acetylase RimI-like enzyme
MFKDKSARYYYQKSIQILKGEGIISFLIRVFRKLKRGIYSSSEAFWFCRDLYEPNEKISPLIDARMEYDSEDEILSWLKKHHARFGWLYIPSEIELKQREKHFFPFVRIGNNIAGYIKVGISQVYVADFDEIIPLPGKTAMVYDTFVLPEYRQLKVASFIIAEIIEFLRKAGFHHLWCHIPSWNKSSINAYSKAGFRKVDHVRYTRLLRWKFFSRDVTEMIKENSCRLS